MIHNLKIKQPINNINAENYYLTLTNIYKQFLKSEYFIVSTEMTSSQLYQFMETLNLDKKELKIFYSLIKRADTIKYAKQLPKIEDIDQDKAFLLNFIEYLHIHSDIKK